MYKFIIIGANKVKAPDLTVPDQAAMCAKARELTTDRRVAQFHVFDQDGPIPPEELRRICGVTGL